MPRHLSILLLLGLLAGTIAPPALADPPPDWEPDRLPGGAMPDEAQQPPSGWQFGMVMTAPMTIGLGMSYLFPTSPAAFKIGGSWGMVGNS
ncbi:MAG TPA: hypothetical protein V6D47_20140, partial [Oscillatoriaceae cyanobacterium]